MVQSLQQMSKAQLLQVLSALETSVGADVIAQAAEAVMGKAAVAVAAQQPQQPNKRAEKKLKKKKSVDFSKYRQRHIAFHVAYDGKKFSGFAAQGEEVDETVEKHLFHAFTKTCLIEDRPSSGYTRCGRTDKGVSAMAQVVALRVRSNIPKDADVVPRHPCDSVEVTVPRPVSKIVDGKKVVETEMVTEHRREYDYCSMLNSILPPEIRVLGWTEVSEEFSARFSASHRGYRYFFVRRNLDVAKMQDAAHRLVGDHDFRNFCKMDILNVSNFRREIYSAEICLFEQHPEDDSLSVYMLQIRGVAFLWHMVRCIMAVLFLVGEGLEAPSVVDELLDAETNPCKPQYSMADDAGLVLNECGFDRLEMLYEPERLWRLTLHYEELFCNQQLEAMKTLNAMRHLEDVSIRAVDLDALMDKISEDAHATKKSRDDGERAVSPSDTILWKDALRALKERGCKIGDRNQNYTPVMQRSKAPTYEARVQELSSVKKREIMEKHQQQKEESDTATFFSTKRKAGSLHLDA